jgi:hypothetical protein
MNGLKNTEQVINKQGGRFIYTVYDNDAEDEEEKLAQPLPDF